MDLLRECIIAWQATSPETSEKAWHVMAFDGVINESHSAAAIVTSYPVDSGFMVSDHTIRRNRVFELDTITSKLSMTVATRRQSFEDAYTEILTAISQAGEPANEGAPVRDAEEDGPDARATTLVLTGGQMTQSYDSATKYGRALYDNDPGILNLLPGDNVQRPTLGDGSFSPRLFGQASMSKVQGVVEQLDMLCATGTIVHVATMRAVRLNCVVKGYSISNNASNAYSVPALITFEQINVIDVNRSTGGVATNDTTADPVQESQKAVREIDESVLTFKTRASTRAAQPILEKLNDSGTTEEFQALDHKEVPFSTKYDTQFVYNGLEYTMGRLRYNPSMECWLTFLRWRDAGVQYEISSLPLTSGVNILQQYGMKIPSLVVVDNVNNKIDPTRTQNIRLYIVVDFEKYFLESE